MLLRQGSVFFLQSTTTVAAINVFSSCNREKWQPCRCLCWQHDEAAADLQRNTRGGRVSNGILVPSPGGQPSKIDGRALLTHRPLRSRKASLMIAVGTRKHHHRARYNPPPGSHHCRAGGARCIVIVACLTQLWQNFPSPQSAVCALLQFTAAPVCLHFSRGRIC